MRKYLLTIVIATILAFSGAQPAHAEGPIKEPAVLDPVEFPAGLVCEFPVRLEAEANRASIKFFPNGRVVITGFLWTRVTNLTTGESISFNTSGPGTFTPNADGSVDLRARGQSLFVFFPGDLGGARLLRTTGLIRETLSADNVVVAFSHTGGPEENLCDTLK
jgi:hypothetical protein